MSTPNKIKTLEKKRARLIREMLAISEMIRGTFSRVSRRCGKPTCWCARSEQGHEYLRITWTEKGEGKTQAIPEPDADWIRKMTTNYRQFRKRRQQIRQLEGRLRLLLDQYEEKNIEKTKRLKDYL